jgi:rifampicin phosphotransferase
MPAPLILRFEAIGAGTLPLVGGKAANLGVLTRAGLPVPSGLCVTTEAYRRVADGAGLEKVLDALASNPDAATLNELSARARRLILAAPVPDDIAQAVRRSAGGPVAVRSSATAEDLPHASFAGQQDTYLNVVGADAVLDAVRRCWASLWTERAVAYRAANGIDHRAVRLAVVIQDMVQSQVAGVMFTANPVTGRRHEAVIDASPGLGESVVGGSVNPDHFVVDTATGGITERRLGDKLTTVRSLPGGGTEQFKIRLEGACVTDDQIRALAALGARVETLYGAPQDIEWAIDAGGFLWLTQARPITTLYPLPERPADGLRVYFCFSLAQGLYRPITPMGLSAFRVVSSSAADLFGAPVADRLAGAREFVEAGGRIFIDVTGVMRSRVGRDLVPRIFDVMEARSAKVLRGLFDDPRLSVIHRSRGPLVRGVARVACRYRIPPRAVHALVNPEAAHRKAARVGVDLRARLALPAGATPSQRLDHVERVLASELIPLLPTIGPLTAPGFLMLALASRLLGDRVRPGEVQSVLRGLPHNVTTEMDLALWDVANRIRTDAAAASLMRETPTAELVGRFRAGTLPPVAAEGLAGFLARYGDRAVAEIDLGLPRWSEDPAHVIGVIANYLRLEDPALAPNALFAKGAAEAAEMVETLSRRAGGLRGRIVRFALGRARSLAGLRELPKYYMVAVLAAVRTHLRAVGADLAGRGLLGSTDDVFFLTLAEVRRGLRAPGPETIKLRELVTRRREEYERELRRRHVPRVLLSDGTEPEAVATAGARADGALTGTPASAGSVTGIARVVLDPVGAHLEPGEILVCPSTDPGWTPLFLTAGGLVMEMGGANSHGAVVAREYGIPAVVGVARATEHIVTGQRITVDGTAGAIVTG